MTTPDPSEIRSTSNPTIKRLVRMRDNRARRRAQRVIIDGWRETEKAIQGGLQICGLYLTSDWAETINDVSRLVVHAGEQAGVLQFVSGAIMEKISYGQSSRGVVTEFIEPDRSLEQLQLGENPLILVLDGIEKPGNMGAVFRCADAAGVDAVIITDAPCDLFNPNAIRNSLGAVFTVPSAVASSGETQAYLLERQIRPLAARVQSSRPLWSADLTGPLAIILGSEADGLGDHWQRLGENPIDGVRIPMAGAVDSLNVSVSAAVIAYEAIRARRAALDG